MRPPLGPALAVVTLAIGIILAPGTGAAVGALGGGLDYMVAANIARGLEVEYMISRGHEMTVADGRPKTVDLDALLMTAGLRIFFGTGSR